MGARKLIALELIKRDGIVRTSTYARATGVHKTTARRELGLMAHQGLLEKYPAGYVLPGVYPLTSTVLELEARLCDARDALDEVEALSRIQLRCVRLDVIASHEMARALMSPVHTD